MDGERERIKEKRSAIDSKVEIVVKYGKKR